jgi:hypothetical protein
MKSRLNKDYCEKGFIKADILIGYLCISGIENDPTLPEDNGGMHPSSAAHHSLGGWLCHCQGGNK